MKELSHNIFKTFGKSLMIYGVLSSLGKFTGLLLIPIYSRTFTPEQYGIIDVISSVTAIAGALSMLQLESAVARHYFELKDDDKRRAYISSAMWTIAALSLVFMFLVCIFSARLAVLLLNDEQYAAAIIAAAITIPLVNLFAFFSILVRFAERPFSYGIIVITQLLATLGASVWFVVYMKTGVIGVFYARIIGFTIAVVLLALSSRHMLCCTWNRSTLGTLLKYSLPMVPAAIASCLNVYINRFIMLYYLAVSDIGIYTVAFKVASVFYLLENALRLAWGPFFWKTLETPNHKPVFKALSKHITFITLALVGLFALLVKEIILIVSTHNYISSAPVAAVLALAASLMIVNKTIGVGPTIRKITIFQTLIYFLGITANIVCLIFLVPRLKLIGVPVSLLISNLVIVVMSWYISERLYFIGFHKLFSGVLFIVTSLVVAFVVVAEPTLVVRLTIAACILIGALIYMKNVLLNTAQT